MLRVWKRDWAINNRTGLGFPVSNSTYDGLMTTLNATLNICKTMKRRYDSDYLLTSRLDQNKLEVIFQVKLQLLQKEFALLNILCHNFENLFDN